MEKVCKRGAMKPLNQSIPWPQENNQLAGTGMRVGVSELTRAVWLIRTQTVCQCGQWTVREGKVILS